MREADTNEDGVIDYEEFIPAMLHLVNAPSDFWDDAPQVAADMPKWDEVPEAMLEKYLGNCLPLVTATEMVCCSHRSSLSCLLAVVFVSLQRLCLRFS